MDTIRLCADDDGLFGFVVRIKKSSDAHCSFEVFEVVGDSTIDNPTFDAKDAKHSPTAVLDEAKSYLICSIKFDGCSDFLFADGGYLHMCGVRDYKKHIRLIEELHKLAGTFLNGPMFEEWD
jgi:hypothetical protein